MSARDAHGESEVQRSPHGRFDPGTVLDGRYRIVSLVGRGGMGEVYRADDLKLQQAVALKILPQAVAHDPRLLEALYNEARQARRVSHRHVCRVHDVGEAEGQVFLTMEFIEGEDLGALLRRIGRFPRDKALELGRQLCEGIGAGHEEGVLHLDLKPSNLMIDQRGDLRITDFGLARLAADASQDATLTGTPAYMAPEQLLHGRASPQADIYAVALIVAEMLSGNRVVPGGNLEEIRRFHESGYVPELPPSCEAILGDCLSPDPAARPVMMAILS